MTDKEFEALNDMFISEGWKLFTQQIEDLTKLLVDAAPDNAITNDQWQYRRGQVHQMRSVLGYEQYIRATQKQQEEDTYLSTITDDTSTLNI